MTKKYTYTENNELWAAEDRAKAAGWEKTSDCYWCQIFRKGEDEVITSREDEGTPVNIAEAFTAEQEQEAQEEAPKAPIKSTTREGKARIRSYILSLYTEAGYDGQPEGGCQDFPKVARFIWDTFMQEKQYSTPYMWRQGMTYEAVFNDWCRGLPSVLDTCFCYNRSAVKEVQNLLCQTDEQVKKYSETMAEDYLIHLIYREVKHAVDYEQEGK